MVPPTLLLLGLATSASADCPSPRPTATALAERITAAQSAYSALDVSQFRAVMADVDRGLPCVTDELPKHLVAEVHRAMGLREFLDRQSDRSTAAFAAARSIEPTYRFPESLVPAGNPALVDYLAVDPDGAPAAALPPPMSGRLLLDGMPSGRRPTTLPTMVQLVDGEGRVTATAYLWPGDAVPAYTPRPPDAPDPHRPRSDLDLRADPAWTRGAVALAAVAGLLYGGAYVAHRSYDDPETEPSRLDGLRATNNGLVLASGAVAVGALGVGASAFLVARF